MQDLPKLRQLDGIEVTKTEKLEAGFQMSSSEEESDDDNSDLNDELHRHSTDDSEGMHQFLNALLGPIYIQRLRHRSQILSIVLVLYCYTEHL